MMLPHSSHFPRLRVLASTAVLCGLLAALPLQGQAAGSGIVVEGVQMPAWIEREGARAEPLAPGTALKPNDKLRTGSGSRLLLRGSDGSAVKLGENAEFKLDRLGMQKGNVFEAAMDVLQGAFRFTTDTLAKHRQRREVSIRIATVTVGIRGTDLWGKSDASKQIVCLLEGKVAVTPPGEAEITLDRANQFYQREQGRSEPVADVPVEQVRIWSAETEIESGRGAVRRGGKWKVVLGSAESQDDALKMYDAARAAGYAASISPTAQGDKRVYSVRIANLPSKSEAESLATRLKGQFGATEPKASL
ncbi:MAG TPA: FecR domain-containing protein [Burkholderiales bacterium]|nr:FecR domain-containing protein [Burkholderiales bacterium]